MAVSWRFAVYFSRNSIPILNSFSTETSVLGKCSTANHITRSHRAITIRKFHCGAHNSAAQRVRQTKRSPGKATDRVGKEIKLMKKPVDDVYLENLYEPRKYDLVEAVTTLKRYSELDFADPNSPVFLKLVIHPAPMKKGRFQNFFILADMRHKFDIENRICVFSDDADIIKEARKNGAAMAGGNEVIQQIVFGKADFDAYLTNLEYLKAFLMPNQDLAKAIGKMMPKRKNGVTETIIPTLKMYKKKIIVTNMRKTEKESKIVVGQIKQSSQEIADNIEHVMGLIREEQNPKHPSIINDASIGCCAEYLKFIVAEEVDDLD